MSTKVRAVSCSAVVLLLITALAGICHAQFNSNIQGVVQDPSGSPVPNAKVGLLNLANKLTADTSTDDNGNFRFLSLAPSDYQITVEATGLTKAVITVTLTTGQTLNVPVTLKLKTMTQSVEVTGQAPVLNTAETRNQMTLENPAVSELPLAGHNMISLVTLAPGVGGLGTMGGGTPGAGGTPGSGTDNYSTETQVDVSANGQGQMSNTYVVDGLDITSGIRQGVLNLTPNPDSIQETSIQVNSFSSEYGKSSSLQMVMTTKSGSDKFHGLVSDYYNYESMYATTHFASSYHPFHSNNMSAAVGGPIIPHHQLFFFFSIEPLRSSASSPSAVLYPDPAFITWAQTNYPSNLGPQIMAKYLPTGTVPSGVAPETALTYFGSANGVPLCGTAATSDIPCSTPMVDTDNLFSTNFRNGTQWNIRVDKYFKSDRIYGNFVRTTLSTGGGSAVPQFATKNDNWERAFQFNWAHTFSPTTINEVMFGANRVEGFDNQTGDFSVPPISVPGTAGYGLGFAQGDFIQHNYHWRDVLTHIQGSHTLKFGYDGWFGDDVEPFQGPYSQPTFAFGNLLTLAQDTPINETGVMYDPNTGQPILWEWNAASKTWGLFAEDTWKVRHNLTLTMGLRWDDYGNPYSRNDTTVFGNFYLGTGQTYDQQIANGYAKATHNALNHSVTDLLSPRVGFAWDPTGKGDWNVHGGVGIFDNWLTQANVQEEFRGSAPGPIKPEFFSGGTGPQPIFTLGDSSGKPPFGFSGAKLPSMIGSSLCPAASFAANNTCLDSQGGIVGSQIQIGAINPSLKTPQTYTYALTVERKIASKFVASVGYSGSRSIHLLGNNNAAGLVQYGVDINAVPGDLITHESLIPTRLNPSFGEIIYSDNNRVSRYNGVFFDLRGRFSHGFIDASYTRSRSNDDAGSYPTALNPSQYYGPSPWDAPNRFSLTLNYQLPGLNGGRGFAGHVTGGWGISGTTIYQTGYPFTVYIRAPFIPTCEYTGTGVPPCPSMANPITGMASNSGDYNADGDYGQEINIGAPVSVDYPNVTSYTQGTSRSAYLTGVFPRSQFPQPTMGTNGNEKSNQFRYQNFAETDAAIYKDNHITEWLNFQLRFEFFNLFNRPNLGGVDANLADNTFGEVTSQQLPRWWQVGAKFTF